MKFLTSLGMVSLPYAILESPYVVLTLCDMRLIVSNMLIIDRRGSLGVAVLGCWLSGQFYHNIFLSHCTIERKVVGDIVDNQIPVSG